MKQALTVLIVSVIVLSFVACGTTPSTQDSQSSQALSSDVSSAQSTSSDTKASEEPEKPKGKVTLKFFTGKIETIDIMNDIINDFNASQERIIVEQEYQKNASNIIQIKFASGEIPDMMTVYTQGYADEGKYLDISDMDEWWSRVTPDVKESCTDLPTGKQFRIYTNRTMAGYWYNKVIFDELGLTPALKWDDFVSNLQAIKDNKRIAPWFIFGREAWHLNHLMEFYPHGYVKQKYGDLSSRQAFLENDQSKINFAAPDGALAVFASNLLHLKDNGLINSDVLTATSDNCIQDFATGQAAMFSNGMWVLGSLLDSAPDMIDTIGFAPYPAYMPDGKPVVLSAPDSGFAISATTPYVDEVKEYVSYLINAENQLRYSESLKAPSVFIDVNPAWAPPNIISEADNALKSAVNIGFTTNKPAGFSGDDSGRMVQDLLSGTYTPESFAVAYEAAWTAGM